MNHDNGTTYATKDKLQTMLTEIFDDIEKEQKQKPKKITINETMFIMLISSVTSVAVTATLFLLIS
jgi:hypothetical protein